MAGFSHLDDSGRARMVNVTEKQSTLRVARAKGLVKMSAQTLVQIRNRSLAKGDPLEVARLAGILAAKNTSQLIPLCHPLALTHADVQCEILEQGIEMEALTAVSVAGLAIYDMCKSVDRNIVIADIRLVEKSGGRSGHYLRKE
jgi:cyclic pyranopterin monophosphate synthase